MHGPGRTLAALVAALGLAFTLAACGGGGGGAPPTAANPTPAPEETPAPTEQEPSTPAPEAKPMPAPETPAPTAHTEADRNRAAGTDPERTFRSARAVTDALPRFGSVTQSTNVGADSITSDRARASFDADSQRLRVIVTREGKDPLILDSNDAFYDSDPGGDDTSDGIGTRLWDTARGTDSGLTVSNISAGWFTDAVRAAAFRNTWSAEGYWLHWAGRNLLSSAPTVTGIEMGAFYDGSAYRSPPESLPVRGTARYEGSANGFVALEYGTGIAGRPQGTVVGADWRGTTTLTADFADNSISGCIGCTGNIRLTEWLVPDGVQRRPAGTEISTRIHLGRTSVGADGTFRGATVTLSDPDASAYPLTSSSGAWGGKFSNIPYSGTVLPLTVAGTVGGKAAWSNGSHAAYVGTFSGSTLPDGSAP